MRSNDMQWDFWTLSPESAHQVTILMSDRGTPRTLRHMNGYGSHTFSWINAGGEKFWVKYHFKTVQGIENYTEAEAVAMAAEDPDAHRRDLRKAIDDGDAPEWRLEVQVMPFAEAADYRFNPFDLTKVWPHSDYPPIEVGRMVLDRNPENFFAEVEQSGFSPANLVPGIGLSPDKMLMGRIFSYHDTHLHRIGANYEQLPINSPKVDGPLLQQGRADDLPPRRRPAGLRAEHARAARRPTRARRRTSSWAVEGGELGRYANAKHAEDDDFGQAGTLVPRGDGRRPTATRWSRTSSATPAPRSAARPRTASSPTGRTSTRRLGDRVAAGLERAEQAATPPQAEVPSNV